MDLLPTWPVRTDPSGVDGPTPGEARGRRYRRVGGGYFVPSDVPLTVEQRIVETVSRLPSDGAVTGWASLRVLGSTWCDGLARDGRTPLPVPVVTKRGGLRDDPSVVVLRARTDPEHLRRVGAVPLVVAPHAAAFEMCRAESVTEAVVWADVALGEGLADHAALLDALVDGRRGVRLARQALGLAAPGSWSPGESRARVVWEHVAGLPRPLLNHVVRDTRGAFLGVPDLLDVEAGVVVEYDGSVAHRGRRREDTTREHAFRHHGLEYVEVVAGDLTDEAGLAARFRQRRARALADRRPRDWVVAGPARRRR